MVVLGVAVANYLDWLVRLRSGKRGGLLLFYPQARWPRYGLLLAAAVGSVLFVGFSLLGFLPGIAVLPLLLAVPHELYCIWCRHRHPVRV